jgi:hypothetical protein
LSSVSRTGGAAFIDTNDRVVFLAGERVKRPPR